jgi:septum formation protein
MRILLASASPRRAELLATSGFEFDVDPADVDERRHLGEAPRAYVDRIARLKASEGIRRHPHRVVVAADTVVVLDAIVLGKPRDGREARDMLRQLSGRAHQVLTGLTVGVNQDIRSHVESTTVWFRDLSEREVSWYADSGEPMDKAGAYAIQGLAARFIPKIEGSYSNVVGLPIAALTTLLAEIGPQNRAPVDSSGREPYPDR